MKKINKLIGLLLVLISFITLSSCSSGAGVKAVMEAKATASKVTITCTFEANSKLETGDAYPVIRQYSYENGEVKDTSDAYKKVTFEDSNTVASVVFDGLERDTKYLFKMYVNYDSTDTYITEIEVTTLSYDDERPIEIASKEDFKNMADDSDGIYVLTNDIDFGNEELSLFSTESNPFKGTFNGDGHTISNIKLSKTALKAYGVFGFTKNAKISNLNIENVTVESSGLGTFDSGALVGNADSTTVSDVTVKNVNYNITVSASGDINVGGVVGVSKNSTFTNTTIDNVKIDFTQARYKVNVGLFAGQIAGTSVGTKTIDGKNKTIVTDACSATGSIKGDMKFTSSTEGYLRAGGFVGFVLSSSSLIYNSYCDATIELSRTKSVDKFDLSVGGFVGSNSSYINVYKCFAKTDIQVSAGEIVTNETSQATIDDINDTLFVANETEKTVAVGGFSGRFNKTINEIKDCYFIGNVDVYGKVTRDAASAERTKFETAINDKIYKSAVGTSATIDGIYYEITGETTYYVKENDNYVVATDVNPDNFSANTYYIKENDNYVEATSYTPKVLTATYLVTGEIYGYTNYSPVTNLINKLTNVEKYVSTSDKTVFEAFVKDFVDKIIL